MYNINIFFDRYNKSRVPNMVDTAEDFNEIIELFTYYGEQSYEEGHLINYWNNKNNSDEYTTDNIGESKILMLDFDVHEEYKDMAHYMNSIKYTFTYNEVKRILEDKNLNYIMYKTKSYSSRKQCFRVVLPLTEAISYVTMKRLFKWLKISKWKFKTLDEVSFRNQIFLLPFNPNGAVDVDYKNDGNEMDIYSDNFFPALNEEKVLEDEKKANEVHLINLEEHTEDREYLTNYIKKVDWVDGNKHSTLVTLIYKFKELGFSFNDIKWEVEKHVGFNINWNLLTNLK